MIPKAGSAYTYGYVVLGEGVGWFIGWDLLLEYTAIVAVVGIGISGYFGFLVEQLGLTCPSGCSARLAATRISRVAWSTCSRLLLCLVIAFVLTRGIRNAARVEAFLVWLKVGLVVLIVALGVFYVNTDNYTPFLPFGWTGVFAGASVVVLRGLRVRRDEHSGRGVRRGTKDSAQGDPVLVGDLDGALCAGLPGADRDGQLHARSIRSRRSRRHSRMSGCPGIATLISVGAILGIATVMFTFMLRRDPGLVLDGPRRPAAQVVRRRRHQAPCAGPRHVDRRHRVRADRRLHSRSPRPPSSPTSASCSPLRSCAARSSCCATAPRRSSVVSARPVCRSSRSSGSRRRSGSLPT